MCGVGMETGEQ